MVLRFILCLCLLFSAPALAAKHAFILGNAAYDSLPDLRNTHADADAYTEALEELGYEVSNHRDLSFDAMGDAFDQFLDTIAAGDEVMFVYSGHGWSDGVTNYLIPTDAPQGGSDRQLKRDTMALRNGLNGVLDELEASGASLTVAVIDACRNNPFKKPKGTRSASMSRGLARVEAATGTFVIFSAAEGQEALDRLASDDNDQNLSVFTRSFVPLLKEGIFLEDAISEAQTATSDLARTNKGHKQHPAYYDQTMGKTCLAGDCSVGIAASPRGQSTPSMCDALYGEAKEEKQCFAYAAFAKLCGDHQFAPLANEFLSRRCVGQTSEEMVASIAPGVSATDKARDAAVLACDLNAASPYDKSLPAEISGLGWEDMDPAKAVSSCEVAITAAPEILRLNYQLARGYYLTDRHSEAMKLFLVAANQDYAPAMVGIALMFHDGAGVIHSEEVTEDWLRRGAKLGDAEAQVYLGAVLQERYGFDSVQAKVDTTRESLVWFRSAAAQSHVEAQSAVDRVTKQIAEDCDYAAASPYDKSPTDLSVGLTLGEIDGPDASAICGLALEILPKNDRMRFQLARALLVNQKQAESYELLKLAANNDHAAAQAILGAFYMEAIHVEKDSDEAWKWIRKAEKAGNADGIYLSGLMYSKGLGVAEDSDEAMRYFREAAKQKHARAILRVEKFENKTSEAVETKPVEVAKTQVVDPLDELRKEANIGNIGALLKLAFMYEEGNGVDKDLGESAIWFQKAATLGHAGAQLMMARKLRDGEGVSGNLLASARFFALAASAGVAGVSLDAYYSLDNLYREEDAAKQLQSALRSRDFYDGKIDGAFGPGSQAALAAYCECKFK